MSRPRPKCQRNQCDQFVTLCSQNPFQENSRTASHRSKRGSEKVLGRVPGKGSQKGSEKGACYGFYSKKGSGKGSQKGFREGSFQKVPRTSSRRVRPLGRAPYVGDMDVPRTDEIHFPRTEKFEPHSPRTTPTKAMMKITSAILGVVFFLLLS